MTVKPSGLHHVTAIAGDPRANLDFYQGLLGLRLVKKTVNFDDPTTYHLYYGDRTGRPGTILTFFPWPGARRGRVGFGQAVTVSFSVPPDSLEFWQRRLEAAGTDTSADRRFEEDFLSFRDPDGLHLELVADPAAPADGLWEEGPVPGDVAVRCLYGVTLRVSEPERTLDLLRTMGIRPLSREGGRRRCSTENASRGRILDLETDAPSGWGRLGAGSVHHVAWRTPDEKSQIGWRRSLIKQGYKVTSVLDRRYFQSIYFREPGGVLFEIATAKPGFLTDEQEEELGRKLQLPPWLEDERARIEAALPPLAGRVGGNVGSSSSGRPAGNS